MRKLTLILAAALCMPAHADVLVGHDGNDSVRLTDEPCTNAGVLGDDRKELRA